MRKHAPGLIVLFAVSFGSALAMAQSNDDATDKAAADVVADQVREQGYDCKEPTKASPDQDVDGDSVWKLTCKDNAYRVRLVPDMAAQVESLD
ncbi:MAG: hypothetical protein ABJP87_06300 [Bauldia litoralis]|uniref:hypothetical protein n=1 Tax=Bauldia litoralis TaxID=665467 RepID=UPI00329966C4